MNVSRIFHIHKWSITSFIRTYDYQKQHRIEQDNLTCLKCGKTKEKFNIISLV